MKIDSALLLVLAGVLLFPGVGEAQDAAPPPPVIVSTEPGGWIGLSFRVDEGTDEVVVEEVVPGAPAEEADIRAGDRLVRWNDREDVAVAIRETSLEPGDTVQLRVRRQGERDRDLAVVAAQRRAPFVYGVRSWPPNGPGARTWQFGFDGDSLLMMRADSLQAQLRLMFTDSLGPRFEELRRRWESDLGDLRDLPLDGARLDELRRRLPGVEARFRVLDSVQIEEMQRRVEEAQSEIEELRDRFSEPGRSFQEVLERRLEAGQRWLPLVDSLSAMWAGPLGLGVAVTTSRGGVAGAEFTDITTGLASYFGMEQGALVLRVVPETPAARAGLQEGDVVVRVEGSAVDGVASLRRALADRSSQETELEVIRHGERLTVAVEREIGR